ncbi:hypothetical protein SAMN05216593_101532 [Pseudomonas asturiensis]|uniref:Uncharacterized protein n=1 Tax=Pseudomonas asturiensis TaxID=1190415 RepID=A0A1M7JU76_9PSED|nr:hypothetical protein [Pseudomonas asturiensis]SHM56097.1 hypothetical protein SAMN05216593_101532 [Pseudomonas asturiensis]
MMSEAYRAFETLTQNKRLSVSELRQMRPVQSSSQDGQQVYHDPVSELVAQDVHHLIMYHMPGDLRTRFVSAAVPSLDPGLRAIANSNPAAAGFYASLAVPFLTALYGTDRSHPDGRLLNSRRASRKLGIELQREQVFQEQQEQLFRYRMASYFPRLQLYLDDQANQADDYLDYIDAVSKAWSESVDEQFDATDPVTRTDRSVSLENVKKAARKAQRGAFWAWALFRELLENVPAEFGPRTSTGDARPEDAAIRIKQSVMLLEALDPSKYFSKRYLDYLNSYTTVVQLASNVDLDQNADLLTDYARAALQQFALIHSTAESQHLREAADIARHLVPGTARTARKDPLHQILHAARTAAAKLEGRDFIAAIEAAVMKLTGAKTEPWLATVQARQILLALLKGSVGAAAIGLVVSGGIKLDGLAEQRGQRILQGIVVSLSQSFAMIMRGATYAGGFFFAQGTVLSSLGHTWAQWKVFDAQAVYSRGFAGWILREKGGVLPATAHWREHVRALQMPGGRYDYGHDSKTISRLFGRNLDEFMAYRVGAVVGAISLWFAISSLRNASEPLDIAAASVSVAGASFGVIGAAGGWVFSAIGHFTTAGRVASFMSSLAFAATIVVVALVVVRIVCKRDSSQSELRKFAQTEAKEAGLYMPLGGAIEYFAAAESGDGVTIRASSDQFLHIAQNGEVSLVSKPALGGDMIWIRLAANGDTQLLSGGNQQAQVWTLIAAAKGVSTRLIDPVKDAVFCWKVEVKGEPVWSDDPLPSATLRSALVEIAVAGGASPLYLAVREGSLVLETTPDRWLMESVVPA